MLNYKVETLFEFDWQQCFGQPHISIAKMYLIFSVLHDSLLPCNSVAFVEFFKKGGQFKKKVQTKFVLRLTKKCIAHNLIQKSPPKWEVTWGGGHHPNCSQNPKEFGHHPILSTVTTPPVLLPSK